MGQKWDLTESHPQGNWDPWGCDIARTTSWADIYFPFGLRGSSIIRSLFNRYITMSWPGNGHVWPSETSEIYVKECSVLHTAGNVNPRTERGLSQLRTDGGRITARPQRYRKRSKLEAIGKRHWMWGTRSTIFTKIIFRSGQKWRDSCQKLLN